MLVDDHQRRTIAVTVGKGVRDQNLWRISTNIELHGLLKSSKKELSGLVNLKEGRGGEDLGKYGLTMSSKTLQGKVPVSTMTGYRLRDKLTDIGKQYFWVLNSR
ncbi:hypothetical protein C0J52_01194 [Blattella germanica]|nr:hypothetical protein C0J52_01194 [Blattella germanica]